MSEDTRSPETKLAHLAEVIAFQDLQLFGRAPSCTCGLPNCQTCSRRQYMRARRDVSRAHNEAEGFVGRESHGSFEERMEVRKIVRELDSRDKREARAAARAALKPAVLTTSDPYGAGYQPSPVMGAGLPRRSRYPIPYAD